MTSALSGFVVGVTGDRRAEEQIELLERRGAEVIHGPTISTRLLVDTPELEAACRALLAEPPTLVVATTGVGVRSWMEAADGLGIGDQLRHRLRGAEFIARSPKAAGALHTADLPVHWRSPGEQVADVLDHLARRDLTGVRVAVQRDGATEARLAAELARRGADVVDVPAYRWEQPADSAPAHRLLDAIADAQVDAITVTSAPALANLLAMADDRGDDLVREQLGSTVVVACVGPVCEAAAAAAGIGRRIAPERFRLGSMVKVLADALDATAWSATVDGHLVEVHGAEVTVDGVTATVSRRVRQVLDALAEADGAVVSKATLAQLWPRPVDGHVVEVTVGRARAALGPAAALVATVPRRGYRLAAPRTTRTSRATRSITATTS